MTRLVHPTAGTVVTVGDSLTDRYRAAGWAEESVEQDQAPSEKPVEEKSAPRARRARRN